jgi:hypothetical protein
VARVEASDAAALRRRADEHGWLLREYAGSTTLLLPDFPDRTRHSGATPRRLRSAFAGNAERVGLEHVYCELMAD